jgi:hypothetical protein
VKPEKEVIFKEIPTGLYYHDTDERAITMVTTVKENYEGFTNREFERDNQTHRSLTLVGYPFPKDFKNMVRSNMIQNFPVSEADIANANKIFGPVATFKGKTVRRSSESVMMEYEKIMRDIIMTNKNVPLAAGIIFVNGVPFMISVSSKIKITTAEHITNR